MRKLLILFVLSILLLTACSYPSLGFYPFGKIWESDGNSATILYAEIANVFESESRQRYAAEDGQALLLIHCDVHLSMGWQIGENSKVSNFGNRYVLQESIVQNNAQGGAGTYFTVHSGCRRLYQRKSGISHSGIIH